MKTTSNQELIDEAIELSDAGKYTKSQQLLTRVIRRDPTNAQAYFERAMVLLNRDRDQEALLDLERCLAREPNYPGAEDWRATALVGTGSFLRAAQTRLKQLRQYPEGKHPGMGVSPLEWTDCAEAFVKAGEEKTAIALLEEYLAHHTHKVTTYARYETTPLRMLAQFLLRAGEATRAVKLAQAAYENLPHRCPTDYIVYAQAREAVGDRDEALRVAEETLQISDYEEILALKQRLSTP
jgi:predicted Zn-dependent protease